METKYALAKPHFVSFGQAKNQISTFNVKNLDFLLLHRKSLNRKVHFHIDTKSN